MAAAPTCLTISTFEVQVSHTKYIERARLALPTCLGITTTILKRGETAHSNAMYPSLLPMTWTTSSHYYYLYSIYMYTLCVVLLCEISWVEVVRVAEMAERKHSRDCREEEDEVEGSSGCKRFRGLSPEAEELIHLLEDADEEGSVAEEEIVWGVMKSLEEEIVNSCCSTENDIRPRDVDEVNYLDDGLGIPSVMGSLLYEPPPYSAAVGEACGGVSDIHGDFADGLWYFEDCNSDWLHEYILYDERQEIDIRNCGDLHEVWEGDPTLLWKQERSCAI